MRSAGVKRAIDEGGRVVIPKDIRKGLGIGTRDTLNIYTEDNRIILEKEENSCVFCGIREDLTEIDGKFICRSCVKKIRNLIE